MMNNKQLLDRAYNRLLETYGGKQAFIEVGFLNRFYQEKMILQECELYTRYLGFLGRVRQVAEEKGEHVFVRGTAGSSLTLFCHSESYALSFAKSFGLTYVVI
jgi:hypothetical protein